jgi:hypothetical protein
MIQTRPGPDSYKPPIGPLDEKPRLWDATPVSRGSCAVDGLNNGQMRRASRPFCRAHRPVCRAHRPVCRAHRPVCRASRPFSGAHRPFCRAHRPICHASPPVSNTPGPARPGLKPVPECPGHSLSRGSVLTAAPPSREPFLDLVRPSLRNRIRSHKENRKDAQHNRQPDLEDPHQQ